MISRRPFVFVFCALAAAAAGAASGEERWTPALSMEYHRVSSVVVSADGELVAFSQTVPLMEGEQSEYRTQIHLVPAAGGYRCSLQ